MSGKPLPIKTHVLCREDIMAAEAAEQRITQALQKELEKIDKECMRPMQVRPMSLLHYF